MMRRSTQPSIASLVRTARGARISPQRQHAAFAALVRRFEAAAFATALAACDDPDAARDACQEAFLDAWRKLPTLREPSAFGGWLMRLVRTHCARRRRQQHDANRMPVVGLGGAPGMTSDDPLEELARGETSQLLRAAVARLPAAQRDTITLFYFLGEPIKIIAKVMGVPASTVGKRLYLARLSLRRSLPRSVAHAFLTTAPTPAFASLVSAGVFAEFEGEYRFVTRPDHSVHIRREGELLVGYGGAQRHVLASPEADVLSPTRFDGEGRFRRDRSGRISHFVYYEFGRRLGVARKVAQSEGPA
jgi:RNA polymerase sigma-70 factor (ECF subfamily)